jgi:hypothetical protein
MKSDIKNTTSDRKFGLVFTALFFLACLYDLTINKNFNIIFFMAGIILIIISLFFPKFLKPFNFLWFYLGMALHKIISPVILAFMFFCIFTPLGLALRLFGKKILPLQFDAELSSYWIKRNRNNSEQTNFSEQF